MTKGNLGGYEKILVLRYLNPDKPIRPFASPLSAGSISGDSPSHEAPQFTQEGAQQLKPQPSSEERESQLPTQSQSQLGNDIINNLNSQINDEEKAKDKYKTAFNELGIWHKKIIKDLGSEEFIKKLIDWNSYNPKELTEDQKTIIIKQRDELIKLFTNRKITNFKKEGAVDGVYKEFLFEDSPSRSDEELFNQFIEKQTKKDQLPSEQEQEIGKLYRQLFDEKIEKDRYEKALERLEIWHKDIITYLESDKFFNKLINWNSCNPEELTENQAIKITGQRDELIDLLTYRKIAKTQPSVEAGPTGPASQEDVRGVGSRAEVPQSSIAPQRRLNESVSSKGANNQGSRNL